MTTYRFRVKLEYDPTSLWRDIVIGGDRSLTEFQAAINDAVASVSDASGSMNVIDEQLIDPRDVSEAYMWLSSDAARYVTGIALPVDAGMLAK